MEKIYNKQFDETYYKDKLDNGLEVVIIHKPDFLTTTACFGTPYGSLNINQKFNDEIKHFNPGIAHFLEHKLFESDGVDVMNRYSELGANVNAFTSYKETVYYFSKSDNDIDACLNLLLDFVQELNITDKSVEKEKGIICEELSMYLQNPDNQLVNESFKSLYKYYPLNIDIGGDAKSVNAITKKELEECYRLNYHPSNMLLVITSPVDPNHIIELIKNNQQSKKFVKQVRPVQDNMIEPDEVVRKEYEFNMDINKGKTCYAIKIKPNFKDNLQAHIKELSVILYLDCYFSPINPEYQRWIEEGVINDMFGFDVSFTNEAAYIFFYMESDDKYVLKDLIDNELKKELVTDDLIEQLRRRLIGNSFKPFNDVEELTIGYTRDTLSDIDFFKEINSIINLKKDDIISSFKELDLSNYSIVHINPLNKDK